MSLASIPPPGGPILVPTTSRAAFNAGLALWSASRTPARLAQRGLSAWVTLLGPRAAPGKRVSWRWPWTTDITDAIISRWQQWFGPFDEWAVYQPAQVERAGFAALLINEGAAVGFVKCRPDWDFTQEYEAQSLAAGAATFSTPRPRGMFTSGGWNSFGMDPLPSRIHSPKLRAPLEEIAAEVSEAIRPVVGRSGDLAPMHGDMGPWNLRQMPGMGPVLFDWEHVGLAPAGGDIVFHAAGSSAMGLPSTVDLAAYPEAVDFWRREIPRRFGSSKRDAALARQMVEMLGLSEH